MRSPINLTAAVVAVGLCLLLAGVSQAAVRTFTWVHPTTNSDGSALPLSQITRTTLVWGSSETTMTSSKSVTGTATTTTLDLAPGTWYVAAKTTAIAPPADIPARKTRSGSMLAPNRAVAFRVMAASRAGSPAPRP